MTTTEETKARKAAYYQANKERTRAARAVYDKEYRQANRERINARNNTERKRAYDAAYRLANKERERPAVAARGAAWHAANKERIQVQFGRRRAQDPVGADLTVEQWKAILAGQDGRCAYCERSDLPLSMEHIEPLARGGLHTASNVVGACTPCNSSKGAKTLDEWLAADTTDAEPRCRQCGGPLSDARVALGLTLCSGPCHKAAAADTTDEAAT